MALDYTEQATAKASPRQLGPPSLALRAVELVALCTFAFAQPILAELDFQFFIGDDLLGVDVVVVLLALVLVPPLVLLLVELVVQAVGGDRAVRWAHLANVAFLLTCIASGIAFRLIPGPSALAGALAILAGAAGTLAYARFEPARSLLRVLAFAPLAFVALFLFTTPVRGVLFPNSNPPLQHTSARAPVVVLMLDEFPTTPLMDSHERIDAGRYPNFARLARGSTWFRNATTVHAFTDYSVPSILSSKRPSPHYAMTAADYPKNLFTLLGRTYDFKVWENHTQLCPTALCRKPVKSFGWRVRRATELMVGISRDLLLPEAIKRKVPDLDLTGYTVPTPQIDGFNRSFRKGEGPTLHFVHVLLPHHPYLFLPSGKRMPLAVEPGAGFSSYEIWGDDQWLVDQQEQRFLLQVGDTDRMIGRMLDRLKEAGLYERAAIVVMADHGSSFRAGGPRRTPTPENLDEIMPMPFFLKAPGQKKGVVRDDPVVTLDMLPTLAAALGTRLPWRADGRNVLSDRARRSRLSVAKETGELLSVDAKELFARRPALLRRQIRRFGQGSMSGIFAAGPHRELLGRRAPEPAPGPPEYVFDEGERELSSYDPQADSEIFPARVVGHPLRRPHAARIPLAVSLNGRVRATTWTYESYGGVWFSALIPPEAVRPGPNKVAVLAIEPGGHLRALRH